MTLLNVPTDHEFARGLVPLGNRPRVPGQKALCPGQEHEGPRMEDIEWNRKHTSNTGIEHRIYTENESAAMGTVAYGKLVQRLEQVMLLLYCVNCQCMLRSRNRHD